MSNPTALVTGASGGIGGATARTLLEEGWAVYGTYFSDPDALPEDCHPLQADFSEPREASHTLAETLSESHDTLNALVHAAGPVRDKTFKRMTFDQWIHIRRTHLDSSFYLARALYPLLENGSTPDAPAHYVLFTSFAAFRGSFGQTNYAASKAGLMGFMMSLAQEWAPEVQVNAIRPPFTESKMTRQIPDSALPHIKELILNDRIADPAQCAELVRYICSQTNLTGQILSADHRVHSPWG